MKKALNCPCIFNSSIDRRENHHNHRVEGNWEDKIRGLLSHPSSIQIRLLQTKQALKLENLISWSKKYFFPVDELRPSDLESNELWF